MSILDKAKDCPYNNTAHVDLPKTKVNINQLRYEICTREQKIDRLQERSLSLKSPKSGEEILLPVRNLACTYSSQTCFWSLNQLLEYLADEAFLDKSGQVVYYCINCYNMQGHNKRSVNKIFMDRQFTLYIQQAKEFYRQTCPEDKEMKIFKHGTVKVNQNGVVEFWYKKKVNGVANTFSHILSDPRKVQELHNIRFNYADRWANLDSIKTFMGFMASDISKRLKIMAVFKKACQSLQEGEDKLVESICQRLQPVISQNIRVAQVDKKTRDMTFTFAMVSECHENERGGDITYLLAYYPYYKLWRKYLLKKQKKVVELHDSAIYLKDMKNQCIYIIGGYKVRYKTAHPKDSYRELTQRTVTPFQDCLVIDLKDVDPLKPNAQIKKPLGEIMMKSGSILMNQSRVHLPSKVKTEYIIDEDHPNQLNVRELCKVPEHMAQSAGVIFNNYIYIFGGSKYIDNNIDGMLKSAYRLNLADPKPTWEKLKPMPKGRRSHSCIIHNQKIYIVGGVDQTHAKSPFPYSCVKIDIYNPKTNEYQTRDIVNSEFLEIKAAETKLERGVVCRVNDNQYHIINGQGNSLIFNVETLSFRPGDNHLKLKPYLTQYRMWNSSQKGPKWQQIYDFEPPLYSGYYYYMHTSLNEGMTRVVYGNGDIWHLTEEERRKHTKK